MIKLIYLTIKKKIKKICLKVYYIMIPVIGDDNTEKIKNIILKKVRKKYRPKLTRLKDYKRLAEIAKTDRQFKVHFGCGARILKDWINIDTLYAPLLDDYAEKNFDKTFLGDKNDIFIIDFRDGQLPFFDETVAAIFSEDFAEHLSQKEFIVFLAETHRILKSGGVNRISTPDLIASMKKNSDFRKGFNGVFTNEWNKYRHVNILTKNYLEELAGLAGYSKIIFQDKNKSESSLMPLDTRPREDREISEQIYCDLIK